MTYTETTLTMTRIGGAGVVATSVVVVAAALSPQPGGVETIAVLQFLFATVTLVSALAFLGATRDGGARRGERSPQILETPRRPGRSERHRQRLLVQASVGAVALYFLALLGYILWMCYR